MVGISCKNCNDRTPTCHSNCEKYLQWKKDFEEYKKMRNSKERKHKDYFYHK